MRYLKKGQSRLGQSRLGQSRLAHSKWVRLTANFLLLLALASWLTACGETPRPTPDYAIPTPPPTPADYNGVPDAATPGSILGQSRLGQSRLAHSKWVRLTANFLLLLALASWLTACGETPRPTPDYAIPTPPPTPADYNGVPDAATPGSIARPTPTRLTGSVNAPLDTIPANDATITVPPDLDSGDPSSDGSGDSGGPGERLIDGTDPSVLARLYGTPGPGAISGLPPNLGNNAQPSRPQPTPTLSNNPQAVRIVSLKIPRPLSCTVISKRLLRCWRLAERPNWLLLRPII